MFAFTDISKKIAIFALVKRANSDNDLRIAKIYSESKKNFENS